MGVMQYGWRDCPAVVRRQIERFSKRLQAILGVEMIGLYLHGSLVFGSFNPERSDIDLLTVIGRSLEGEAARQIAGLVLESSGQPCPIEITFVTEAQLHSGECPLPFTFHYSETWRGLAEQWREHGLPERESELRDDDLAGQVALTLQHGIPLIGEPPRRIMPDVPMEQVTASFRDDCNGALEGIGAHPVYGVLNPCRTLYFLSNGGFCSKDEGASWALDILPESEHPVIEQALALYRGEPVDERFDPAALERFVAAIRSRMSPA